MDHISKKIDQLKDSVLQMMFLAKSQLEKGEKALLEYDEDLAHEIIANEKRVNALELKIDEQCEQMLALYNPVANDLRFVLAVYKINAEIERLADHTYNIAGYILDFGEPMEQKAIEKMRVREMYEMAKAMMSHVFNALIKEDTALARKVFKHDKLLNDINSNAAAVSTELINQNPSKISLYLYLFSIIRKLERMGDLTKNVAEEIIFYIEARVLKHQRAERSDTLQMQDEDT